MQLPFDPYPQFRTERLQLDLLTLSDDEAILQLRADERVNRYIHRETMRSLEESHAFIEKVRTNIASRTNYYWAVRRHEDPRLIGTCCLFNIDPEAEAAELGYELVPDFQGQGIMREAVGAVINFAEKRMQARRLDAWIHSHNQPSMNLAAHFGFVRHPALEEKHRDLPELNTLRIYSRYAGPGDTK